MHYLEAWIEYINLRYFILPWHSKNCWDQLLHFSNLFYDKFQFSKWFTWKFWFLDLETSLFQCFFKKYCWKKNILTIFFLNIFLKTSLVYFFKKINFLKKVIEYNNNVCITKKKKKIKQLLDFFLKKKLKLLLSLYKFNYIFFKKRLHLILKTNLTYYDILNKDEWNFKSTSLEDTWLIILLRFIVLGRIKILEPKIFIPKLIKFFNLKIIKIK